MNNEKFNIKDSELVILVNERHGGISYRKENEEQLAAENADEELSQWTSKKRVFDRKEWLMAQSLYSSIKNRIGAKSVNTVIGIMCSQEQKDELKALDEVIRLEVLKFNSESKYTKIRYALMFFNIIGNEQAVAEAIKEEIMKMVSELSVAIKSNDPKLIREIITRAGSTENILLARESSVMRDAISASRKIANEMAKAARKRQEGIEYAMKTVDLSAINTARMVFIDDNGPISINAGSSEIDGARFEV